jgi:hypothetical protein
VVSSLLRVTALVCLAWAVLLLGLKDYTVAAEQPSPVVHAFANGLGIANLVFAYVFWHAARAPAANRAAVYGAIMLLTLKTANDLYELLVLLPAEHALVSLADLVLSVGLLVGILEALPRMLASPRSQDGQAA